jgi:UDP-3-O-[3-hydroxymyristoyl] N-acetylglucosamine deacetylase
VTARATTEVSAIAGQGLHTGAPGSVRFARHDGPVSVRANGVEIAIADLRVVDTARSTTVANASGSVRIATVEHVFAALGGLGLHADIAVVVEGREAPLADGGARAYAAALRSLGGRASPSPLRVVRDGVIEIGATRYALRRNEAGHDDDVELEVAIDFDDARIATSARWCGDADDFFTRIAPARTFGFEHEVPELLARGLATHVSPESVIVVGKERILSSGAPFTADEPVRHKLLDLIGDLYLYGGPPRGRVRATRPGHAVRRAIHRQQCAAVSPVARV